MREDKDRQAEPERSGRRAEGRDGSYGRNRSGKWQGPSGGAENRAGGRSGREDERSFQGGRPGRSEDRVPGGRSGRGGPYGRPEEGRRMTRQQVRDRKTEEIDPEAAEESFLSGRLEGRNAVLEAYRSGRTIERLYVQEGLHDGPIETILREAAKAGTSLARVSRDQLDAMSETGRHQGVIARAAAFAYGSVEDMLRLAREKGEDPFLVLLDGIEDPHNLGAIIRTACLAGAHGVIIPKHRAVGLTPAAVRASAGAVHHIPVAKVANIGKTIEELRSEGIWFVCADMDGEPMTKLSLTGPIGLVIGSEGSGVGRLVREKCDFTASIPRRGPLDSLNASVAAGVLMYEILRQREL